MKFLLKSSSGMLNSRYIDFIRKEGFEIGDYSETEIEKDTLSDYRLTTIHTYSTVEITGMESLKDFLDLINKINEWDVKGIIMYSEDISKTLEEKEKRYVIEIYDEYRE